MAWARHEGEIRHAQRLRCLVFADEMGARLKVPRGSPAGHDNDLFDPFCEHLLVRATADHANSGPVVGTYRVLTPNAVKRAGGLFSETEFDLTRLRSVRVNTVNPVEKLRHDLSVETPALIKGYLRCGARVLAAPAWDPDFNTADLPMLLRIADLPLPYRKHFLRR